MRPWITRGLELLVLAVLTAYMVLAAIVDPLR